MAIEFRETSNMGEIDNIIHEMNGSLEWGGILDMMGPIHRVGRLRGRITTKRDIPDVLFDLESFVGEKVTGESLDDVLRKIAFLETTYYSLAGNFAIKTALQTDIERLPDIVDLSKNIVSLTVWKWWRPENGEDFLDLNRRIISNLKNLIFPQWNVASNRDTPFSYLDPFQIERGSAISRNDQEAKDRIPISRLREAVGHLSLPSIIASIEKYGPLETLTVFSVMGYCPGVSTFSQLCSRLKISRPTASVAFDRAIEMMLACSSDGRIPSASIRAIFDAAFDRNVLKFSSGRTLRWNDPRINLVARGGIFGVLNSRQKRILELALIREKEGFKYEPEDIGEMVGCTKSYVHRTIKRAAMY